MKKNTNLFKKKLEKDSEFTNKILQSIKHPHIFIKTITIRIISEVFNDNKKFLNFEDQKEANNFLMNLINDYNNNNNNKDKDKNKLNTLQIIFDNLKFIILCKDFNLKENCGIIKLESLIKNMKKKTNLSNYLLTLDMIEIELNVQSEKNDLNKIVVDKSLEDKNYLLRVNCH